VARARVDERALHVSAREEEGYVDVRAAAALREGVAVRLERLVDLAGRRSAEARSVSLEDGELEEEHREAGIAAGELAPRFTEDSIRVELGDEVLHALERGHEDRALEVIRRLRGEGAVVGAEVSSRGA